jgi:hypothetical protein
MPSPKGRGPRRMDRARGPYFVDGSGPFLARAMMTTSATLINRQLDNPATFAASCRNSYCE